VWRHSLHRGVFTLLFLYLLFGFLKDLMRCAH
jgi:hypothetical protein